MNNLSKGLVAIIIVAIVMICATVLGVVDRLSATREPCNCIMYIEENSRVIGFGV